MKLKSRKSISQRLLTNGSNGDPTPGEVAVRAYAIWEQEGRPEGRDFEHWLQAEAQLQQGRKQSATPA